MSLDYHRLPGDVFTSLASGGGGRAAIDLLRRVEYSKHALLLRGMAPESSAAYEVIALAEREDPAATAAVIRHPSVGAWAYRTMLALRGGPQLPGATPNGLATVAAAAAVRAGLPSEIRVPVRDGLVMLPSLGAAEVGEASVATVRTSAGRSEVESSGTCVVIPKDHRRESAGWHPLHAVLAADDDRAEPFEIVVDDIDPFRMPAAPHLGAAPDLGRWRSAFAVAWELLRRHHPAVAAEVAAVITVAVPLAAPPRGLASSSSPEAFGAVALSEPTAPVDLAVTLAHEVQHMKLSAMLDILPLTRPDHGQRYYAPWREDPRPASGLLQGAYAYLGVTGFWRRQRSVRDGARLAADVEFARWRDAALLACLVLQASGQLTSDGERFVATMVVTLRAWCDEPVPEQVRCLAHAENKRHLELWQERSGPVTLPRDPALPQI
jgi:HEXXH motif-containing protein